MKPNDDNNAQDMPLHEDVHENESYGSRKLKNENHEGIIHGFMHAGKTVKYNML